VTILLEPSRLALFDLDTAEEQRARLEKAIGNGLRATLARGSLLTGALIVELVIDDEPEPPRLVASDVSKLPEIPTRPAGLVAIENKLESAITKLDDILAKVDELPLDELVKNASDAAAGIERLADSPDLARAIRNAADALEDVKPTLADLRTFLHDADMGLRKIVVQGQETAEQAQATLLQAEKTLAGIDEATGPDSRTRHDLTRALEELTRAARSLREFSSYLERHPEALLHGKPDNGDR
jgi:paraquat-inducible protein B